ncbi:MAG: hypothetical protein AB8B83_09675 [Bdellovibrionales bacterium]
MKTDIYQKIEADFGANSEKAHDVIDELDKTTKGMVDTNQIRALIFDAKGNLERLREAALSFKYNEIIEQNPNIDFHKTFHELELIKKKK